MDPQPNGNAVKDGRPCHKWTTFEGTVLMSLIIRNIHKTGLEKDEFSKLSDSTAPRQKHRNTRRAKEVANPDRLKYVDVATALNRALHKSDYTNDIPVEEVQKLLHFFLRDRKGAIAVIDRQPTARLTRSTHRIWNRGLNFLGTITEWDNGRKAAEEVKRREGEERRLNVGNAGAITAGANTSGVAGGWGDDTAVAPTGDGWGTAADENTAGAPVPGKIVAWGDAMEVDPPVTVISDLKTSNESSRVKANVGAWGSDAAGSSTAVSANSTDPWGVGIERTVKPNSAMGAWGEPEASKTVSSSDGAAADWSATEDPFATPLPPSLVLSTNKTTTPISSLGVSGVSTTTSAPNATNSDPWAETPVRSTDPVSDTTASAWGCVSATSTTGLSSTALNGLGKTTHIVADPWGNGDKPSLASTGVTPDDPWGTSAESAAVQPYNMDWSAEVPNMTSVNSVATKTVGQAAPLGVEADKSTSMDFSDSWGAPTTDTPHRPAYTTDGGWGAPASGTPHQPANTTDNGWGEEPIPDTSRPFIAMIDSEWGENVEKFQGGTSQVDTRAQPNFSEGVATVISGHGTAQWSTAPAPVPPGPGPAPTTLEDSDADSDNQPLWSHPNVKNPSVPLKNQNLQGNHPDKTPNNPVQVAQLAGSGINPARLAMMAAIETDDEGELNFETTADERFNQGRKSFKPTGTFGSKDNAIPLKFNRMAEKQPGSGDSNTTPDDWA